MLHSAVLLDASMTVRDALDRLARNGYWLDPEHPAAKRLLAAHVARVAASASTAAAPKRDARPRVPSTREGRIAPAAFDVAAAARVLARPHDEGRVVIRRERGATVYWYTPEIGAVLRALVNARSSLPLHEALGLREEDSVSTQQIDTLPDPDALVNGVALSGNHVVGVGVPMPPATRARNGGSHGVAPTGGTTRGGAPGGGGMRGDGVSGALGGTTDRGTTAASDAPQVEAYPDVRVPEQPVVGVPFDVDIGLQKQPAPGQTAGPMVLRGRVDATTIPVDVRVVAEGFTAPDGWEKRLAVDVADPERTRVGIRLVAASQVEPTRQTTIIVQFAVDGVTCGTHSHHVVVASAAGVSPSQDGRGTSWTATQPSPPGLTIGALLEPCDVELNIAKPDGNAAKGNYVCTMRNAHGVDAPAAPIAISLGDDARTFAKSIIDDMSLWDGEPVLDTLFAGHGATIASKLPDEFWTMLRAVAAKVTGRPLTLQLNSAEPYVPWELALVDPPLDATRPPMLAAQVVMGRWILGDSAVAAPPRARMNAKRMAAMAGMYNAAQTGLKRLLKAEAEVDALEKQYHAITYDCDPANLKALLDGGVGGGAQVVHFAGHGQVDPTRPGDAAIFLNGGKPLTPVFFRRTRLGADQRPFIFFNACMVGTGGEMLGDFGGFPGNCLAGGFTALVAPLWSVDDDVASWMALQFYAQALASPAKSVAGVLRELRSNYGANPSVSSYLAYVYYGNPNLEIAWA